MKLSTKKDICVYGGMLLWMVGMLLVEPVSFILGCMCIVKGLYR